MEYVTLNNGIKMPKLGYGVYQTPPEDTRRCVLDAIEVGYRSIDTAQAYNNEEGVGSAIAECGLPREEFFLTTKVWITNARYEKAKVSIKDMFTNPVLTKIGAKYGKTAAQTALRFLLQNDVVIIPKSVHKERMKQNFELFDFSLTAEDMAAIEALDSEESLFFSHYDPKTVEWFMSIV